jgi:uncharacterized protein
MTFPVEVRELFGSLSASRTVSGQIGVPDIELGGQTYHFEAPADFRVTLTNAGAGIVSSGAVTATFCTPCVRCLCDTCVHVEADVEGFYVLPGHDTEIPEEQEYEIIGADMTVDLEPSIAQSLVVELPFAPVHDPDCKGICPLCGGDLNVSPCDCSPPAASSPFDVLKGLDHRDGS